MSDFKERRSGLADGLHDGEEFLHDEFLRRASTDTKVLALAVESEFPHDDDVLRRS